MSKLQFSFNNNITYMNLIPDFYGSNIVKSIIKTSSSILSYTSHITKYLGKAIFVSTLYFGGMTIISNLGLKPIILLGTLIWLL
jgi:hypothetical protein